jgi:glutamate-ammonia-ligase adenylyltransferase
VIAMRRRLEDHAPPNDLKRGPGGIADIEFLVQMLSLRQARGEPLIVRPNIWDGLDHLKRSGLIPREAATELRESYEFLRTVESRLRIVYNRTTSQWPEAPDELARLARRLGFSQEDDRQIIESLRAEAAGHAERTRGWFEALVGPVRPEKKPR